MPPRRSDQGSEESGYEKAQRAVEGTAAEDPIRKQRREELTRAAKPIDTGSGRGNAGGDGGGGAAPSPGRERSLSRGEGDGGSNFDRGTSLPDKSKSGQK